MRAYVGVNIGALTVKVAGVQGDARSAPRQSPARGRPLEVLDELLAGAEFAAAEYFSVSGAPGSYRRSGRHLPVSEDPSPTAAWHSSAARSLCRACAGHRRDGAAGSGRRRSSWESTPATGATHFDAGVDTIFEIGGQDAKYIYLRNGVPIDYAMNNACSAGTGSFLEECAQSDLGITVSAALSSDLA